MFKKHALQVRVVKNNDDTQSLAETVASATPQEIAELSKDFAKEAAQLVAKVYITKIVVAAACTIVVKIIESKLEN